jgi:hypothetical protein
MGLGILVGPEILKNKRDYLLELVLGLLGWQLYNFMLPLVIIVCKSQFCGLASAYYFFHLVNYLKHLVKEKKNPAN